MEALIHFAVGGGFGSRAAATCRAERETPLQACKKPELFGNRWRLRARRGEA
jgi:hypothetical protein